MSFSLPERFLHTFCGCGFYASFIGNVFPLSRPKVLFGGLRLLSTFSRWRVTQWRCGRICVFMRRNDGGRDFSDMSLCGKGTETSTLCEGWRMRFDGRGFVVFGWGFRWWNFQEQQSNTFIGTCSGWPIYPVNILTLYFCLEAVVLHLVQFLLWNSLKYVSYLNFSHQCGWY